MANRSLRLVETGAEPEPRHGEEAANPSSPMSAPVPVGASGDAPDPVHDAVDVILDGILTRMEAILAKLGT